MESKEWWLEQVKEWKKSRVSAAAWCRQHKLTYHRFLYWRGRMDNQKAAHFVELADRDDLVTVDLRTMTARMPVFLLARLAGRLAEC